MLVFIGALRHPEMANDYTKVESLLRDTLLSVCNQTDDNFKVLVVCNKKPRVAEDLNGSFVEYIEVDLPCPVKKSITGNDMRKAEINETRKDKGNKYIVGIAEAQQFKPDYIMFFDTDDFVSSNVARFVNASGNNHNGWFIDKGFIHCHDTGLYYEENNFNQKCGTSVIINNELLANPVNRGIVHISTRDAGVLSIDTGNTSFAGKVSRFFSKEDILHAGDNNFLKYIIGSHRWAAQYYNLSPLPFRGAIWNINTGENNVRQRTIKQEIAIDSKILDMREFIPDNITGY
jgi:hypothetical protein